MEQYGFGKTLDKETFDGERTRELEVADDSAPYIDRPTYPGDDRPTVELVADGTLLVSEPTPPRANPVSAYLAGLSESSRRPMRTNLETIARLVSGGRVSAMDLAWWNLRHEHTSLIRSTLAETYAPATANLMLSEVQTSSVSKPRFAPSGSPTIAWSRGTWTTPPVLTRPTGARLPRTRPGCGPPAPEAR